MLESLLQLFDSIITYRTRYRSQLNPTLALHLLLLSDDNPRSVAFQFRRIEHDILKLPSKRNVPHNDQLLKLATSGISRVRLTDAEELLESSSARQTLDIYLQVLQKIPNDISTALTANFFTHTDLYRASVSHAINYLCMTPRDTDQQTCDSSELIIAPAPAEIRTTHDYFGNEVAGFSLNSEHERFEVTVKSVVDTMDQLPPLPDSLPVADVKQALAARVSPDTLMAQDCLFPSAYVPFLAQESLPSVLQDPTVPVLAAADNLMQWIFNEFQYDPSFSTVVTPISDVLQARKGVCQDFAHLAIALLRQCGIPARYVSGYLETLPPPGQQKLQGSDASHAWFAVYSPGTGWFDFDPTNNKRPDFQYITTAWGRDYADVAPLRGIVVGGGQATLNVAVDVERLH